MAERRWAGFIAYENQETGDDRMFLADALSWSTPIPFKLNHDDEEAVGVVSEIQRLDGGVIYGEGVFFDSEAGRKAAEDCERSSAAGMDKGVSVDLDDVSMELRIREQVLAEQEAEVAAFISAIEGDEESPQTEEREVDENGRVTVASVNSGDYMTVFTSARIRGLSFAVIPAFAGAAVHLLESAPEDDDDNESPEVDEDPVDELSVASLVAGAYPVAPPAEWFENPAFTEATPLVITDEGRIYGHGATWGTFHIGFAGQRIEAPRSMTNYAYFQTGAIRTAEGVDIPIGRITMSTGHAQDGLSAMDTLAHYDNTAAVVADVTCGEDEFGIWVSGALRPNVTDEQVRELRAAPLSGDWREIRGNLELVALLAVNTAGFPIPRMSAMVASGEVRSLVASAQFGEEASTERCSAESCGCQPSELSREEQIALRDLLAERNAAESEADAEAVEAAVDEEKVARAAAAKRKFRIEQAKLRALKAKGN